MKTTEHIEYLLRQGKKPKELIELGFSKRVITRVRRRLREEKAVQKSKASEDIKEAKRRSRQSPAPKESGMPQQGKLEVLESDIKELGDRLEHLEVALLDNLTVDDLNKRLAGTPVLGLRHQFQCSCNAKGFVALRIQCTKCGKETWWGWFPK